MDAVIVPKVHCSREGFCISRQLFKFLPKPFTLFREKRRNSNMTRILVAALLCVHFVGEGRTLYVNKKEDMSQSVIREHSFSAPFFQDWWQGGVPNFKTIGGAVVTDEAVLLTQDRPNQSGTIINSVPMVMDHWELKINFRIHGKQNPGADGMALWYTERPATLGPIYGQYPSFKGFGIILDSFDNNNDREQPGISMVYPTLFLSLCVFLFHLALYNTTQTQRKLWVIIGGFDRITNCMQPFGHLLRWSAKREFHTRKIMTTLLVWLNGGWAEKVRKRGGKSANQPSNFFPPVRKKCGTV